MYKGNVIPADEGRCINGDVKYNEREYDESAKYSFEELSSSPIIAFQQRQHAENQFLQEACWHVTRTHLLWFPIHRIVLISQEIRDRTFILLVQISIDVVGIGIGVYEF